MSGRPKQGSRRFAFYVGRVHVLGYCLGVIALIISSHIIMLLLVRGSAVFEERHGAGVCDDEFLVLNRRECPASALCIDCLRRLKIWPQSSQTAHLPCLAS